MYDSDRLLITGGCGFIGTRLIAYLIQNRPETKIRVLDNLSTGSRNDLSKVTPFLECRGPNGEAWHRQVHLIVGDIVNAEVARLACSDVDRVVHLAANSGVPSSVEDPGLDLRSNVIGTFNMLEASLKSGVKRFVFASSGAPIGQCEPPIHEEMACHPVSPYGASKLAGEGYCSAFYHTYGLETVILRFSNVYGPGSRHKSSVVAKFINQAIKGEPIEVFGSGEQTRDFVYVQDLVRAICLALRKEGIGGEIFQIATNTETTISDILDGLRVHFRKAGLDGIRIIGKDERIGDVRRNCSDITKAGDMLGWKPEIRIEEGLEKTFKWFEKPETRDAT
jgi:UDP-glucose 4-epimerase